MDRQQAHQFLDQLAPRQAAEPAALPEELGPARLIHGGVGVLQDWVLIPQVGQQ